MAGLPFRADEITVQQELGASESAVSGFLPIHRPHAQAATEGETVTIDNATGIDTMQGVDEILARGTEPCLLHGSQYLETLRDGCRGIDNSGREILDVTEHPLTVHSAQTLGSVMDIQHETGTISAAPLSS
ncbi:hypothetical protein NicSoilE8_41200 (plasmid) [Arthrobacter sp. NicSoilE8]|nr:hypothetical protein NicSoilE8_41200 [Arthrobacter sp. NicSoilE8]